MRGRTSSKFQLTRCTASILLSLCACGKDGGRTVRVVDGDSGVDMDAQVVDRDARVDSDGQAPDGSAPNGRDAASGDGGAVSADGSLPSDDDDAGRRNPFNPREDCDLVAENSELSLPVTFSDETGFDVTPGLTGFGVAYQSNNCGAIGVLPVASVGEYPEPSVLYESCDSVAQGVSLLHVSSGFRLTWVDNSAGSAELQSLQLPETLKQPGSDMRTPITHNQTRELAPVQARFGDADYLGWIDQDDDKRQVLLQAAGSAAEARVLVAADSGFSPRRLALAQLGAEAGALAFVSEEAKPGVWLVPLTAAGEATQAPIQLSSAVTTGNSVDIATRREDGGAVLYSVDIGDRHEVRFRRLNPEGGFASDEVKVVTFPMQGRDASLSRLGGGYAVAFRSIGEQDPSRGEVRLMFVTKEGNLQRDTAGRVLTYLIAEASATGGRVATRISRDGQLLVAFLDVDTNNVRKLRLFRRRLDCAL